MKWPSGVRKSWSSCRFAVLNLDGANSEAGLHWSCQLCQSRRVPIKSAVASQLSAFVRVPCAAVGWADGGVPSVAGAVRRGPRRTDQQGGAARPAVWSTTRRLRQPGCAFMASRSWMPDFADAKPEQLTESREEDGLASYLTYALRRQLVQHYCLLSEYWVYSISFSLLFLSQTPIFSCNLCEYHTARSQLLSMFSWVHFLVSCAWVSG
jgi:hypothetical protein